MKCAPLFGCGLLGLSGLVLAGSSGAGEAKLADVVKEMLDTMEKMTTSLGAIKDEATAKTATPDLRKAALHWKELYNKAEKIKPPSKQESERLKKAYKEKIEATHKKLFGEIARVKNVPGGRDALKEIKLVVDKAK